MQSLQGHNVDGGFIVPPVYDLILQFVRLSFCYIVQRILQYLSRGTSSFGLPLGLFIFHLRLFALVATYTIVMMVLIEFQVFGE